jgi:hypothetical protein
LIFQDVDVYTLNSGGKPAFLTCVMTTVEFFILCLKGFQAKINLPGSAVSQVGKVGLPPLFLTLYQFHWGWIFGIGVVVKAAAGFSAIQTCHYHTFQ